MYIALVVAETADGWRLFPGDLLCFTRRNLPHLIFWVIFNIVFLTLFYRHARSLWIGTSYLTGGVYADPDDERATSATSMGLNSIKY